MLIRPLTAADVDAVAEVDFAACHDVALRHGMQPPVRAVRESRALVRDLFAADPLGGFVAEENGRVAGHAWLHARGPIAVVGPIAVEPAAQRRGLGRALLAHCLQAAGSRTTQVRLVHDSFDTSALQLWMSEGFRIVAPVLELELAAGAAPPPETAAGPGVTVRPATAKDQARIVARDARTFGAPRPLDVERLLRAGRGVIAERGTSLVGFALGGAGRLGPSTSDDPALVLALLAMLANESPRGEALRVMVVATDRALVDGLRAMGFRVARTCLYMIRGGGTAPPAGYVLMGAPYA